MTDIATIQSMQDAYFAAHGKYQQFTYDGATIGEYTGPLGPGYIVYEYKEENGINFTKATDFGNEGRSFDWQEIEP
jgi:hypothetical protein